MRRTPHGSCLQLRITGAALYADMAARSCRFRLQSVPLGRFRSQQPFRCGAGAHGAQAAQPAAGSRCSSGAGGHGARAPAGAGERPGATGRERRERPSGNARPAAARRTGGGRGAGAASATGGAVGTRKGWPRLGRWLGRQRCRLMPARRCDRGSAPPRGHPLPVCVGLSGSAARASAEAALAKGPPDCQ